MPAMSTAQTDSEILSTAVAAGSVSSTTPSSIPRSTSTAVVSLLPAQYSPCSEGTAGSTDRAQESPSELSAAGAVAAPEKEVHGGAITRQVGSWIASPEGES